MSCGITWYGDWSGRGEGKFGVIGVGGIFSIFIFTILGELSAILMAFVIFPNTSASSVITSICLSPMFGKCVAGAGYFRAWISSFAAIILFSTK